MFSIQTIIYTISAIIIATIAWEHAANANKSSIKPSIPLAYTAKWCKETFLYLGRVVAKLSSFYDYLYLEKLGETIHGIAKPIIDIFTSPFWTIVGYLEYATEYGRPALIFAGSATLIMFLVWGICRLLGFDLLAFVIWANPYKYWARD